MFVSAVIILESLREGRGPIRGDHLHGWFLRDLIRPRDPALACLLHEERRHKLFTMAVLARNGDAVAGGTVAASPPIHIRITGLGGPLSDLLLVLAPQEIGAVRLGDHLFQAVGITTDARQHPWAGRDDANALWSRWVGRDRTHGRVRLHFASPTAFERRVDGLRSAVLFPEPDLVFRSLAEKWNAHSAYPPPLELVEGWDRWARVSMYALRTALVRLGAVSLPGFMGTCVFAPSPDAPPAARQAMSLLAEFAFYAGVGLKTTMGMGQVMPRVPSQGKTRQATRGQGGTMRCGEPGSRSPAESAAPEWPPRLVAVA